MTENNFEKKKNYRDENEDSITEEQPDKQNGNGPDSDASHPFDRETSSSAQQKRPAISLSLRNLNSLRNSQQPMTNGDSVQNATPNQTIALDSESEVSTQNHSYKRPPPKNPSTAKFEAFGRFLASSLIDLPEKNALELVERFTSDIVKSLIASKASPDPQDKE